MEPQEDDVLGAFLKEHPGFENLTCEEAVVWLEARRQDIEEQIAEEDRAVGQMPLCDVKLFMSVMKPFGEKAKLWQVMEMLRRKKRRGHRQQKALDIFDRYYADGGFEINTRTGEIRRKKEAAK